MHGQTHTFVAGEQCHSVHGMLVKWRQQCGRSLKPSSLLITEFSGGGGAYLHLRSAVQGSPASALFEA